MACKALMSVYGCAMRLLKGVSSKLVLGAASFLIFLVGLLVDGCWFEEGTEGLLPCRRWAGDMIYCWDAPKLGTLGSKMPSPGLAGGRGGVGGAASEDLARSGDGEGWNEIDCQTWVPWKGYRRNCRKISIYFKQQRFLKEKPRFGLAKRGQYGWRK
jgi:hypothetical protein